MVVVWYVGGMLVFWLYVWYSCGLFGGMLVVCGGVWWYVGCMLVVCWLYVGYCGGSLDMWVFGMLVVFWSFGGILVFWCFGMLVFWL